MNELVTSARFDTTSWRSRVAVDAVIEKIRLEGGVAECEEAFPVDGGLFVLVVVWPGIIASENRLMMDGERTVGTGFRGIGCITRHRFRVWLLEDYGH